MSRKNGGSGPRTVALVGPFGSGKTTLLESILAITGAIQRKGSVPQRNTVGDSSPEARARQMSVEVNCATTKYLDETFTFLDCPGSIEFLQDTLNVLPGVDAAVVVCEPDPAKVQMLKPFLKRLSDLSIPISSSSTKSKRRRARCANSWPDCRKRATNRCCCGKSRSGKTGL